jgi:three-Cys-motif partner protein
MSHKEVDPYFEREQTRIKHLVLEKYLERFARIVGSHWERILYIDGFSGPWNTVSDDFKDSSFAIALRELRAARDTVRQIHKKELRIQCVFLEKDPAAFEKLHSYATQQTDAEVTALNLPFEEAIPKLVQIAEASKKGRFPFILIDPKGWKGFSMELIAPLIRVRPCEVLVNFMTSHIQRFIEDERDGLKASFKRLFGDDSYEARIEGSEGQAREDAIVAAYADRLAAVGDYPYASTALVLHPTKDRTHYHLVYATRDIKGIEVFKDAERKALKLSESLRADAKRRRRESATGQVEMFGGQEVPETEYLARLQAHFEVQAETALISMAKARRDWDYDALYAAALRFPTVQEAFLKRWLHGRAEFVNLGSDRAPKIRRGHRVCFHGP